jgi:hypothetical protein
MKEILFWVIQLFGKQKLALSVFQIFSFLCLHWSVYIVTDKLITLDFEMWTAEKHYSAFLVLRYETNWERALSFSN